MKRKDVAPALHMPLPPVDPDDVDAWMRWTRAWWEAAADGMTQTQATAFANDAVASGVTFLVAELFGLAVYVPLRKRQSAGVE